MAVMGRPVEFEADKVREIRLPKFPKSLDERFKKVCKDRGEKPVDMIRAIIAKELNAKFVTKPSLPLEKNETFLNRKYRNISVEDWAIFQSRALYYEEPATDLLMKLINVEVLRHEKQSGLITRYQMPFRPELSGEINFTLKLPREYLDAIVLMGKDTSQSVVAIVNNAIRQVDNPEFTNVVEFDQAKMKNIVQRRLVGVDRALWGEFRKFCITNRANTNRLLIGFIRHFILLTCDNPAKHPLSNAKKIKALLK